MLKCGLSDAEVWYKWCRSVMESLLICALSLVCEIEVWCCLRRLELRGPPGLLYSCQN
jgi:hypothetical protein